MISKIVEIEWDIKLETLSEEFYFQLVPVCTVLLVFEDKTQKEFQFQMGDKTLVIDFGPLSLPEGLVNKIIERIKKPLENEVYQLMRKVENLYKYGSFDKEFLDQFWVDNAMGK
jgi:hypothetical protein